MAKITFDDKVAIVEYPEIPEINKMTDANINEIKSVVNSNDDNTGALSNLNTSTKTNVVAAVNEVNNNVGTLSSLSTTTKTSAVAAINELNSNKASKNEVLIQNTEPTAADNKIWIDSGAVSSQASEITNSYSTSTGIGYSANYTNDKLVKVGTTIDSDIRTNILYSKNLFDKNNRNVVNLYPSSTGTLQNNSYKSLLIEIKPNTTYTFTSLNAYSDGISLGTYTSIPTTSVTPTNRVGVTATENHGTITSGASDRFLLAYVKWSSSALTENELNGIMLEKGSTQSPYQPYVTPTINVDGEEIYVKGQNEIYSLLETRIGTWANNKPLYRKVIDCGYLPNNATKNITTNLNSVNAITKLYGVAYNSSGVMFPIPYSAVTGVTSNIAVYLTNDFGTLNIQTGQDRTTLYSYVIIEYTKN